jgi:hypothetical protein
VSGVHVSKTIFTDSLAVLSVCHWYLRGDSCLVFTSWLLLPFPSRVTCGYCVCPDWSRQFSCIPSTSFHWSGRRVHNSYCEILQRSDSRRVLTLRKMPGRVTPRKKKGQMPSFLLHLVVSSPVCRKNADSRISDRGPLSAHCAHCGSLRTACRAD